MRTSNDRYHALMRDGPLEQTAALRTVSSAMIMTGGPYSISGRFAVADSIDTMRIVGVYHPDYNQFVELTVTNGSAVVLIPIDPLIVGGYSPSKLISLGCGADVYTPDDPQILNRLASNIAGAGAIVSGIVTLGAYKWGVWNEEGMAIQGCNLMTGPILSTDDPACRSDEVSSVVAPAWTRITSSAGFPTSRVCAPGFGVQNEYFEAFTSQTPTGFGLSPNNRRFIFGMSIPAQHSSLGQRFTFRAPLLQRQSSYSAGTNYLDMRTYNAWVGVCAADPTSYLGWQGCFGLPDASPGANPPSVYPNLLFIGPLNLTALRTYSFFIQDAGAQVGFANGAAPPTPVWPNPLGTSRNRALENDMFRMRTFISNPINGVARPWFGLITPAYTMQLRTFAFGSTEMPMCISTFEEGINDQGARTAIINGI